MPMAGCGSFSPDQVIAQLTQMGFESSAVLQAVKEVGPLVEDAVEYILNGASRSSMAGASGRYQRPASKKGPGKRILSSSPSLGPIRQSSILDHFQSASKQKRFRTSNASGVSVIAAEELPHLVEKHRDSSTSMMCSIPECSEVRCPDEVHIGSDWEQRANSILRKHFGYQCLKSFQKEALAAWVANQDCLVLAATGSGKSLCFQIPALLTGKVVVVISPLISLMHDQCLKLSKHGVSACFLGSGQPDSSVEKKAMRGMYNIIYVCPETVLRLIKPLQHLAENRGVALFAIDEVHCVSKWGHDFRPDYRRMSVLRESFTSSNLKFLRFDIPLMALTATATIQFREDILKSLRMSTETKIVLTSFFRSNLQFSVKHSRTSSSSYEKDFRLLIDIYGRKNVKKDRVMSKKLNDGSNSTTDGSMFDGTIFSPINGIEDDSVCTDGDDEDDNDNEVNSGEENGSTASGGKEMSVEYLENNVDIFDGADDWDVACGEFCGESPKNWNICGSPMTSDPPEKLEERSQLLQEPLQEGPTIIYVPTRKETLSIAKYLCGCGVKAAAYNASLSKSHLRQVHKEFQENKLEVVVATVAFGMGIDKSNIRRIFHYGWPQSLEAYHQEVGRAGRDGRLADCILFANLSRVPSLLPSKRSEDQTKLAYKMLSDCFRYGMNTSHCRAKMLVEYFGEDFSNKKCLLCDVCANGPPKLQNMKEEADILMQAIAAHHSEFLDGSYGDICAMPQKFQKPNLRMFVSKIREQSQKFWDTNQLWWRGLARILENKGYIREGDTKSHVQIKFPEPTKSGLEFLQYEREQPFNVYPEADMLLSMNTQKSYPTFADWGKGWADPEIRRQRLEKSRATRKPRKSGPERARKLISKIKPDQRTARGRIAARLLKQK